MSRQWFSKHATDRLRLYLSSLIFGACRTTGSQYRQQIVSRIVSKHLKRTPSTLTPGNKRGINFSLFCTLSIENVTIIREFAHVVDPHRVPIWTDDEYIAIHPINLRACAIDSGFTVRVRSRPMAIQKVNSQKKQRKKVEKINKKHRKLCSKQTFDRAHKQLRSLHRLVFWCFSRIPRLGTRRNQ